MYRIIRVYEDNNIIIYKRLFHLTSESEQKYFEYDKEKGESTGKEFKNIRQVRKYTEQSNHCEY
jgi:hypothetical protein